MNPTMTPMNPGDGPASATSPDELLEPALVDLDTVLRQSGYQSLQPVMRPVYWGVDLDRRRRPGVPMMREPRPWPNSRFPVERQPGEPASPMHGRTNKTMPPVFGTAVPLKGLSGVIRRAAYRIPDHYTSHWMLMMVGDRVEAMGHRARRVLPVLLPLAAVATLAYRQARRRR